MANQRATAAEATAVERRRRRPGNLDRMQARRLAVSDEIRDANPDYVLRWSNDADNRIYARTKQDDWEKVSEVEPLPVDTDKFGKPIYAHLLRKKREFWNEDQKAMLDDIKSRERRMTQQAKIDPEDTRPDEMAYAAPDNSITTSGYKP